MATRTVAYLTPLYFDPASCLGGGERYPLNLARGVVAASGGSYTVELISFGTAAHQQMLAPGVMLRVLEMTHRPRNTLDVTSRHLPDALAGADLVHIHQAYTRCCEVGLLVAKHLGKPVCVTDHGGHSSHLGQQLDHLDLADQIVAYSDFGASLYRTSAPVAVIKGGVDADGFRPPRSRPRRDRVLYVGRLLAHKGIDQLLAALPAELPLTVCGRPYHADYYSRLQALAAGKDVTFLTDIDDDAALADLYSRAWACVLPSVYQDCYGHVHQAPELMGFTLLEAMACGTPAIASRVAAMPEFIKQGETGFVFGSLEELGNLLRLLAAHPERVEAMGHAARQSVEREYDLEVAGAKLWAIYERLIARTEEAAA